MELILSPTPKPSLTTVLSESRRLIKSYRRRFLALFVALFFITLVPLAFSFLAARIATFFTGHGNNNKIIPMWTIAAILISLIQEIFSSLAAISVTSITLRSFNSDQNVRLNSIAKTISTSFFPLVTTNLLQFAIILAVFLGFSILFLCVVLVGAFLGFEVDPSDISSLQRIAMLVMIVPSVLISVYLYGIRWAFTTVIVVAESTRGFEALKRSQSLVNGKRRLILSLGLIFGVSYSVIDWISNSSDSMYIGLAENNKINFVGIVIIFVAKLVVFSSLRTMVRLYNMVANTLLYVFCKAFHEEGYSEDNQYVRLAVDDSEKVDNSGVSYDKGGYTQV